MAALRLGLSSYLRCISSVKLKSTTLQDVCRVGYSRTCSIHAVTNRPRTFVTDADSPKSSQAHVKYEESQCPQEWKYVERLLPKPLIPEPTIKKEYPSGWKPQDERALNYPYYVARTKNHMLPVYLQIRHRGIGRLTKVRNVKGDIWTMAKELKQYVEQEAKRDVAFQVNEMTSSIKMKGDFHVYCVEWLSDKGF